MPIIKHILSTTTTRSPALRYSHTRFFMQFRLTPLFHTTSLADPVERQQAPLAQIVLLALIGGGIISLPINLKAVGGAPGQ